MWRDFGIAPAAAWARYNAGPGSRFEIDLALEVLLDVYPKTFGGRGLDPVARDPDAKPGWIGGIPAN